MAQLKHVRHLSLAQLEALALEMEAVGAERGKIGLVVVKRRAGRGRDTPRLVVMTEGVWRTLAGMPQAEPIGQSQAADTDGAPRIGPGA